MSELKTLKDLPVFIYNVSDERKVQIKVLRQEAIKWIKFYRSTRAEIDLWKEYALIDFFNITDEELKE